MGYAHSGFAPLRDRATAAITLMMENYPGKWVATANGIAMQRARILLPLAFLVRVNNSALHRQWLFTAVDGLLTRSYCAGSWCAFKEELSHPGWGGSTAVPKSNAEYGTGEAPLNQNNDDPVSDLLYTSNFALLGLHEAAAATGNETIRAVADKLADFLVRQQAKSSDRPELDGAWMRAFDYEKWEWWASDGDVGWGAWSVESGWTQSWLTITLGMRQLNTSLWELGAGLTPSIRQDYTTWIPMLFPPLPTVGCLDAQGNTTLFYTLVTDSSDLCAPAPGASVSHVLYNGSRCGDGKAIVWHGMHTLDPRAGLTPAQCSWTSTTAPAYTGACGAEPTAQGVRLPTHVC